MYQPYMLFSCWAIWLPWFLRRKVTSGAFASCSYHPTCSHPSERKETCEQLGCVKKDMWYFGMCLLFIMVCITMHKHHICCRCYICWKPFQYAHVDHQKNHNGLHSKWLDPVVENTEALLNIHIFDVPHTFAGCLCRFFGNNKSLFLAVVKV